MATKSLYEEIHQVIQLSTKQITPCKHCHKNPEDFSKAINHYIEHGYKLLHVGSEFSSDRHGEPCHYTVAVLGI